MKKMGKMVTRKVEWITISEDEYYSKGIYGRERASEYMGTGYTIKDYYSDNAGIVLQPWTDNDYYYIDDDGEKILVIVWEYYYISVNGNEDEGEEYVGTLEEAMEYADTKAGCDQSDILIFGENGDYSYSNDEYNLIARRKWHGETGNYGEWEIFY